MIAKTLFPICLDRLFFSNQVSVETLNFYLFLLLEEVERFDLLDSCCDTCLCIEIIFVSKGARDFELLDRQFVVSLDSICLGS